MIVLTLFILVCYIGATFWVVDAHIVAHKEGFGFGDAEDILTSLTFVLLAPVIIGPIIIGYVGYVITGLEVFARINDIGVDIGMKVLGVE